ncbi:hypothetical protein [Microbacterium invictum]|uniref:Uncharacterized protein n=1 Tax=Microbacterium invictum TaxID=515415 RepID=A0ABZ0VID9_9MICO|nr:hypothetical protein [Microbacterium invictum]WQB71970.1 hypothetical protein T9R20_08505 [Microbacterium invictum]
MTTQIKYTDPISSIEITITEEYATAALDAAQLLGIPLDVSEKKG